MLSAVLTAVAPGQLHDTNVPVSVVQQHPAGRWGERDRVAGLRFTALLDRRLDQHPVADVDGHEEVGAEVLGDRDLPRIGPLPSTVMYSGRIP